MLTFYFFTFSILDRELFFRSPVSDLLFVLRRIGLVGNQKMISDLQSFAASRPRSLTAVVLVTNK